MTNPTTEGLRAWYRGVEAIVPELYNAGCAMCGSPALARETLHETLVGAWAEELTVGVGFRETVRVMLRREAARAVREAKAPGAAWPGLRPAGDEDALMALAAREAPEAQRMILLRYGCGLSPRAIAPFLGCSAQEVRAALERFESRCRKQLPERERRKAERRIAREAHRALALRAPDMPSKERVYRDFEAEAMSLARGVPRVSRILSRLLIALMAMTCAAMFWLFAVLCAQTA